MSLDPRAVGLITIYLGALGCRAESDRSCGHPGLARRFGYPEREGFNDGWVRVAQPPVGLQTLYGFMPLWRASAVSEAFSSSTKYIQPYR